MESPSESADRAAIHQRDGQRTQGRYGSLRRFVCRAEGLGRRRPIFAKLRGSFVRREGDRGTKLEILESTLKDKKRKSDFLKMRTSCMIKPPRNRASMPLQRRFPLDPQVLWSSPLFTSSCAWDIGNCWARLFCIWSVQASSLFGQKSELLS